MDEIEYAAAESLLQMLASLLKPWNGSDERPIAPAAGPVHVH